MTDTDNTEEPTNRSTDNPRIDDREPHPMPQGGDYTTEERILHAIEHQTDQLERMADALESIAVNHDKLQHTQYGMLAVLDGQSVTFGDESASAASDSPQADTADDDDDSERSGAYHGEYRQTIQQSLLDAGVDVSNVSIIHEQDDERFRLESQDDLETGEGSAWDGWTSRYFGEGLPGWIDWETYEKDDGSEGYYPAGFVFPYAGVREVFDV